MKATPEEIETAVRTLGCGLVQHFPADEGAREIIMLELSRIEITSSQLDDLVAYYLREKGEWKSLADMLDDAAFCGPYVSCQQVPDAKSTLKMLASERQIEAPPDPVADAKLRADIEALGRKIKLQNARRNARPVREIDVKTPLYLQ